MGKPKYISLAHRIAANCIVSERLFEGTPCWIWTGTTYTNRTGMKYPRFNRRDENGQVKHVALHREIVREIHGKRLTKRGVVLHRCNDTLCVNPLHLAGGGQKANMRQCVRDGRHIGFGHPSRCADTTEG